MISTVPDNLPYPERVYWYQLYCLHSNDTSLHAHIIIPQHTLLLTIYHITHTTIQTSPTHHTLPTHHTGRGMADFEEEENDRPQFDGQRMMSYINGKVIKYYPASERSYTVAISSAIISCSILFVICVVATIFYANYYVVCYTYHYAHIIIHTSLHT